MPIHSNQYTVGTAAIVQIVLPDVEPQKVWIHDDEHSASTKLYLGNASVSSTTGLHFHSDQTESFDIPPDDSVWAIATGGDVLVHVMRVTQH
jgi:hypothetical protein